MLYIHLYPAECRDALPIYVSLALADTVVLCQATALDGYINSSREVPVELLHPFHSYGLPPTLRLADTMGGQGWTDRRDTTQRNNPQTQWKVQSHVPSRGEQRTERPAKKIKYFDVAI